MTPQDADSCVSGRLHIDSTVANHHGTFLSGAGLAKQSLDSDRMGLLLLKTVTTINAKKMTANSETFKNCDANPHRLIRQDSFDGIAIVEFSSVSHTGIEDGVVEHVVAVVREKVFEALGDLLVRGVGAQARRIKTGAPLPT